MIQSTMLIHPSFLALILLLLSVTTSSQYHPKDHYLINFGLPKSSTEPGDTWRSDEDFLVGPPSALAANTAATAVGVKPPYDKARIFEATVTYSIPVSSSGPKLVRLYLYPPTLTIYNSTIDPKTSSLNLVINEFEVLRNFSANLVAANAIANPDTTAHVSDGLVKEIYVTVAEERDQNKKSINLTFSPSSPNGFGFINGIEINSVPEWLYINRSSVNQPPVPYLQGGLQDYMNSYAFPNSLVMENVIRLNVGGSTVEPSNDTGIGRTWYSDDNFVRIYEGTPSNTVVFNRSKHIRYTVIAPFSVYSTMRTMGPYYEKLKKNLTWEFEVDNGFEYLVRLHFCELDPNINEIHPRLFYININDQKASDSMNVYGVAGGLFIPTQRDFVTLVNKTSSPSRVLLPVTLIPDFDTRDADALLNGLEIFKLNSTNGSLAAPNPALPKTMIQAPINTQTPGKSKHLPLVIGSILAATLVSLSIFVCLIIVYRRNKKKKQKFVSTTTAEESSKLKWVLALFDSSTTGTTAVSVASKLPSDLCQYFTLAQIKVATCDFDKDLIIGTGGFGKVYKGSIDGGTTTVAIKRLNSTSKQGAHEFQTEIEMLSRLRHVHLVSLIGYCEDFGEMILVYDYMPNGTLRDQLLYKNPQINCTPLSWKQRLMICVGSARGLHYLHAGAKQLIIHRDVKSTNILLDDKWTAKVSDFGLSKVGPDHTKAGTMHVSTAVKGSAGYLDPEYYRRHQLTEKSDVYSFGVVLFEVLCARAAVNPNLPKEEANLAMWARSRYKEGILHTIVDPNLTGQIAPESLRKFGEIANMCVRDRGIERPSMGDVLWGLEFALQLQETAENNNIANGTPDESFDLSSSFLSAVDVGFTDNDVSTNSGDNFTQTSLVEGTSNKLTYSKSTTSTSSDYPVHTMAGSVFSEIVDPKAR